MALAFDGNIVYVADSSSNGGITKFNPSTSESQVVVRNGTRFCHTVHGLELCPRMGALSSHPGHLAWFVVFHRQTQISQ